MEKTREITIRRRLSRKVFAAAASALVAPLGRPLASRAADAQYTLRLSLPNAATSVPGIASVRFASSIGRRSGNQLKVEVYPNGQLAKEQEAIDGLTSGVVDFTVQSSSFLVSLFPRYQVFDLPFLFKDINAAFRVFDGPIGDEFLGMLEAKGILGLGWGTNGFKQIETTTKSVVVPDDMKGLRLRVQPGPIYVATQQALGAIPVTIDIAETFAALSQHTIDGMDLSLDSFTSLKYYTVAKHIAMSNHILSVTALLGSKRKIEALPAPLQRIVKEEGKAVGAFWRALYSRQLADSIQLLKNNGVTFTDIQYPAFRKAVEPVFASAQARIGGDVIERVSRAAGSGS
jgi:TRAP-type transport system periplasmic protein